MKRSRDALMEESPSPASHGRPLAAKVEPIADNAASDITLTAPASLVGMQVRVFWRGPDDFKWFYGQLVSYNCKLPGRF